MLQTEPDLIQSTRVLPKSAVHSSCSRDVLLKIDRNLDRKPTRQSSLPIHKFPFTASLFVSATPNKNAVHFQFAAQQMLPTIPAWVPRDAQESGIKPKLHFPAHVATQSSVGIEHTIADRQFKSSMRSVWNKSQNARGK